MEINRDELAHFLKIKESYERIGAGVTDATVAGNPKTTEQQYIHERVASTKLNGYAPSMAYTANVYSEDPVNEFLYDLGRTFKNGKSCQTTLCNVELWTDPTGKACKAVEWNVEITVDNPGSGASGGLLNSSGTIYYRGNPVEGTFDTSTKKFTATLSS